MSKSQSVQAVEVEIRTRTTLRVGDKLRFCPGLIALGGEHSDFFQQYNNMEAAILGFDEGDISLFGRKLTKLAGGAERTPICDRVFVKFENGDTPKHSIALCHFMMQ